MKRDPPCCICKRVFRFGQSYVMWPAKARGAKNRAHVECAKRKQPHKGSNG